MKKKLIQSTSAILNFHGLAEKTRAIQCRNREKSPKSCFFVDLKMG